MAHTYYITAAGAAGRSQVQYSAFEQRCLQAWFALEGQPRGFRRWLAVRWLLMLSSERVVRHVRICAFREQLRRRRRQQRAARLGAFNSG